MLLEVRNVYRIANATVAIFFSSSLNFSGAIQVDKHLLTRTSLILEEIGMFRQ